jgi:hypothetical protein
MAISPIILTEKEFGMGLCGTSGCTSSSGFCALLLAPAAALTFSGGISWWVSSSLFWGSCVVRVSCFMASVCGFGASSSMDVNLLTGEIDRPSTGRVEPVRGCLNNPSRLVWTTLTSLTAPLAALRSRKETKEKVI